MEFVLPQGWPKPKGYANGVIAEGKFFALGGVVGWDETGAFAVGFVSQVRQALINIKTVLEAGGASPRDLIRLTWFVRSVEDYLANQSQLGQAYREVLGGHYPAMSVIEVSRFVEPNALVEIEATAVIGASAT